MLPGARTRVLPIALFLLLLATTLFWAMRDLRSGAVAFVGSGTDVVSGMVPHLSFIQEQLQAGRLPLWNPHIVTGQPELGGAQWAIFYPFQFLLLPRLSVTTYIKVTLLFHLLLLGLGCFLLTRRWLRRLGCEHVEIPASMVGVVVPLSGFVMGHLYAGHLMLLQGLAYVPLMIWGGLGVIDGRRGAAMVCAASAALLVLAGAPQVLPMAFVAGAALWGIALAGRPGGRLRAGVRLAACVLAGIMLSGPQLLPALELASLSLRSHLDLSGVVSVYALSLSDLPALVLPGWAGAVHGTAAWEFDAFVGVPVLVLAVLPLHERRLCWPTVGLWLVSALCLVAGGGWAAGVLGQLPGYSLLRVPSRLLLVPVLLLPVAAAMGLSVLSAGARRACRWSALYALLGAMGAAPLALRVGTSAAYLAVAWAGLCALVWFLPRGAAAVRGPAAVGVGLVVLLVAGAGSFQGRAVGQIGQLPPPVSRLFAQAAPRQRVLSYLGRSWNRGMAEGFLNLGGYEPFASYRTALLLKALSGADPQGPWSQMHVIWPDGTPTYSPLWDLFAVRFALIEAGSPVGLPLRLLRESGGMAVVENARALPRAYFHPCPTIVNSPEEALVTLSRAHRAGGLPPAVVEAGERLVCPSDAASSRVQIASDVAGHTVLQVDNPVGGYLVLSDLHYPGWHARVDGRQAAILHANAAGRAVRLPAGSHRVVFEFEPESLSDGFRVALAGVIALMAVTLLRRLW